MRSRPSRPTPDPCDPTHPQTAGPSMPPNPEPTQINANASDASPVCVMIVDDEPTVREVVAEALTRCRMTVIEAATAAEARSALDHGTVDVALIDVKLPDADGIDLAAQLKQLDPTLESIVVTGKPSTQRAVGALRIGAADFLSKPFDLDDLTQRVDAAVRKRGDRGKQGARVDKLKKLCRKLNRERHEVTQQVDILCNDLVTAYQELAGQMRHVQLTTQLKTAIDPELDLETVLRRALEFVLEHIGPTNAVVFLPGRSGSHTVGGYINYTFDKETADVLLAHLADVAAPRIAEQHHGSHLTDDGEINLWLSDDSAWLADCQVLAVPCRDEEGETLANLLLFRDATDAFNEEHLETLEAIAPVFATQLSRVISIHHRAADEDESEENWDDEIPF